MYWNQFGYGPPNSPVQFIPVPSETGERKSLYDRVTDDLNGLKALQKLLKEDKKEDDKEKHKHRHVAIAEAWSWVVLGAIPVAIAQLFLLKILQEVLKF